VFQLCRRVWQRWIRDAVLAGALEPPGFARDPAGYVAVKWIPPKWDWVDPLKDRKAEIEAIEQVSSRAPTSSRAGCDAEEAYRRRPCARGGARAEVRPAGDCSGEPASRSSWNRERPNQSEEQAA
jgi:capsid protein